MHSLMMLLWISLIIVLNVRGEIVKDNLDICDQCNHMSECTRDDVAILNFTISCPQTNGTYCKFGVVEPFETANSSDYLCLIVENSPPSSNLLPEEIQKTQTMLPLPLAHHMVTAEAEEKHFVEEALASTETHNIREMSTEADEKVGIPNDVANHEIKIPANNLEIVPVGPLDETDDLQLDNQVDVVGPNDHEDDEPKTDKAQNSETEVQNNKNSKTPESGLDSKEVIQLGTGDVSEHTPHANSEEEVSNPSQLEEHTNKDELGDAHMELGMGDSSKTDQLETQGNSVDLNIDATLKTPSVQHEENTKHPNSTNEMYASNQTNTAAVGNTGIESNPPSHALNSTTTPDRTPIKCFDCLSTHDKLCISNPTNEKTCKDLSGSDYGCYTLLRVDTNVTIRGCISDLAEEGHKYCKNTTFCNLCYEQACNYRKPPTSSCSCMTAFISLTILAAVITSCLK